MDKKQVTGSVVSISRADKNGKCILEVRPDFQGGPSKYTTKYTGIKADYLTDYADDDRVTVELKKGKLKDGGDPNDDQKGYWWDFVSIAKGDVQANGHGPGPSPAHRPQGAGGEPRERSIERQVALKAAVEWGIHEGASTYHVGQIAEFFASVLAGTAKLRPIHEKAKVGEPEEEPEPLFPDAPPKAKPGADNVGAVLMWALQEHHLSKDQAFALLGVTAGNQIMNLAAARQTIADKVAQANAKAQDGNKGGA